MNILPKGVHPMRIIAFPLARVKISPDSRPKPSDFNANTVLVFYHFDLISPCGGRKDCSWHRKVLKSVMNKAADFWTSLGKAPKGSWKLWTYELGERMVDRIEFEELALRNIDPSLESTVLLTCTGKQVNDVGRLHSLPKVPLIYPPSLYPTGTRYPPLGHLQTLLGSRGPRHRRGFYLWMLIAPLTAPITLIPIIPNLPLFFCVWRSWSHYRAYRSSRYLSSLLDRGLIEPNPSLELDGLYASFTSSSGRSQNLPSPSLASRSPEKSSTFGDFMADRKSETASGTGASRAEYILTREAIPKFLETFRLPESTVVNMHRAMDQARVRLGKSP
ncbi:mitochondrial K+-H+ exchange-related-domain-containing protein [Boletus coccyginus]|nr:mitochondrial K+-H+ exchange-related-domain-containing protein [Boletus coccyginus]